MQNARFVSRVEKLLVIIVTDRVLLMVGRLV
jgi:hypothetical protein